MSKPIMEIVIKIAEGDFDAIRYGHGLYMIGHDRLDDAVTEAFEQATILPEGYDNAQAAKSERSKGEWIPVNPDCRGYPEYFKCSICGAHIYTSGAEKELDYNGCPYCFADMRGYAE